MKLMMLDAKGIVRTIYESNRYDVEDYIKKNWTKDRIENPDEDCTHEQEVDILKEQFFEDIVYELQNGVGTHDFIAIVDMGLWNGRKNGYKTFIDPVDILSTHGCDDTTVTIDQHNVRAELHHHDGTHYVLYRVFKDNISERQAQAFKQLIMDGQCTGEDVKRYTTSIRPLLDKLQCLDFSAKPKSKGDKCYAHHYFD